jgi:hypothetical protein
MSMRSDGRAMTREAAPALSGAALFLGLLLLSAP